MSLGGQSLSEGKQHVCLDICLPEVHTLLPAGKSTVGGGGVEMSQSWSKELGGSLLPWGSRNARERPAMFSASLEDPGEEAAA